MTILIPNQPFVGGESATPELFNLIFNQVFDDLTQYLGHHPRISDDSLSNDPNAIKSLFYSAYNNLRVTQATTPLTVRYNAGSVRSAKGDIESIASGVVTVPNNSTSYVYVNFQNSVVVGTNPNIIRLLLAKVVTSGGSVTSITDLRPLGALPIAPALEATKIFGGIAQNDYTILSGLTETFDNQNAIFSCRNFTMQSGSVLNINQPTLIQCSGDVNITGANIVAAPFSPGGGTYGDVFRSGNRGGVPGEGPGQGSASTPGRRYGYNIPYGSGGASGFVSGTQGLNTIAGGGAGGSSITIEAAGSITINGSTIQARGGNGFSGSSSDGSAIGLCSGGGGGSGGLIYLKSYTSVTLGSTTILDVRGGNGGNGVRFGSITDSASGGGGGGGGHIVIQAPIISNSISASTMTNNRAGGTAGTTASTAGVTTGVGGGGGGGYGGTGGFSQANGSGGLYTAIQTRPNV